MSIYSWEGRFWIMLGKDIIAACLRMVRLVVENLIQWLGMVRTRELYPSPAIKYLDV